MEVKWIINTKGHPTVTLYKYNAAFNRRALEIMDFPQRVNIGKNKDGQYVFQRSDDHDGFSVAGNQISGRKNIDLPNGKYLLKWADHAVLVLEEPRE